MRNAKSTTTAVISRLCAILAFGAMANLSAGWVRADPPESKPAADAKPAEAKPAAAPVDSPEVKEVRDQLIDWDKNDAKMTLEQERKCYHTDNDKEAQFMDFVAHENWEESKTQQAVRDKWGPEAEAKFAHLLSGSTIEDDQVCDIKVDGNHAVATWSNIKDSTPLTLVKIDGKWLVDGHAMYEEAVKDDPAKAPEQHGTARIMKQATADIADGKFDDADGFLSDFKAKLGQSQDGN
jgi:hypothetical protein